MAITERDSEARARVVQAATRLFVRDGFKATSMKAIADQVGISPPALYWHFASKQDLYLASMEELLGRFVQNVSEQVTGSTPTEQLRQYVSAHVMWKLEQRDEAGAYTSSLGMRDIVHGLPPDHQRILIEWQRDHLERLRGILHDGVDSGEFHMDDVKVTTFAILTMCEYVVAWYDPTARLRPSQIAKQYSDLAVAMAMASGISDTSTRPARRPAAQRASNNRKRATS
jgi:AcrR family transcriptional regulator